MGEPNLPETIGQYKITECHSEGQIARMCRAVGTSGQGVMIRILDPIVSRNERIRALMEELRDPHNPRRIHDPHVVRILHVAQVGDSWQIIYEDFGGVPLDEWLRKERPALKDAVHLARMIGEGLRAIHGHRIVHGDVKPQNILVARDSHGKLIVKVSLDDLALVAPHAAVSIYGELVGTPKYLAPERIRGRAAGSSSDIFALGVIYYEMFAGREPFPSAGPVGYLHANIEARLDPPSVADSAVPTDLSQVICRMLARDPRERYRTVQAVLDDLDRVESRLNGVTPERTPPGADSAFATPVAQAHPHATAWRAAAIIASTVALFLLITVLIMVLAMWRARAPEAPLAEVPVVPRPLSSAPPVPSDTAPIAAPAVPAIEAEQDFAVVRQRVSELLRAAKYDDAVAELNRFATGHPNIYFSALIQEETAAVLLAKGEAQMAAGNAPAALETFKAILAKYPDTPAASAARNRPPEMLLQRAGADENRGELESAISALQTLTEHYPDSSSALVARNRLPRLLLRFGQALEVAQPEKAIEQYRAVIGVGGNTSEAATASRLLAKLLFQRAESRIGQKQYREALQDLRDSNALDPTAKARLPIREPEALAGLALQLKAQGKPAEGAAVWKELVAKYPGVHLVTQHAAEMAPLLAVAPPATAAAAPAPAPADNAAALLSMAEKEIADKGFDEARPRLEKILKDHPGTPQAARAGELLAGRLLQDARELARTGKAQEAAALFARISRDFPGAAAAAQARAELARISDLPQGMVYVPGGSVDVGLNAEQVGDAVKRLSIPSLMVQRWLGPQMPVHSVRVKAFYIDRNEVTHAEYEAYIKDSGAAPPSSPLWDGPRVKEGNAQLPVAYVTWAEAAAFAKWAGKRLPTEAEWEHAARGDDGRLFPWGNDFLPRRCVTAIGGAKGPAPVGLLPDGASPYGVNDMIGNVQEWTRSEYKPYPGSELGETWVPEDTRVVRGAGWDEFAPIFCLATTRFNIKPDTRSPTLGFRCVKDAE